MLDSHFPSLYLTMTLNSELHHKYQTNTVSMPIFNVQMHYPPSQPYKTTPKFSHLTTNFTSYQPFTNSTVTKYMIPLHNKLPTLLQQTTIQKRFSFPQITYITEITLLTIYMVDKSDTRTTYISGRSVPASLPPQALNTPGFGPPALTYTRCPSTSPPLPTDNIGSKPQPTTIWHAFQPQLWGYQPFSLTTITLGYLRRTWNLWQSVYWGIFRQRGGELGLCIHAISGYNASLHNNKNNPAPPGLHQGVNTFSEFLLRLEYTRRRIWR